jgi:hypothetical protein
MKNMTRTILAATLALLPSIALGQSGQVNTSRLSVASSGASPAVGSVRLGGLGTTGGTEVLFTDANRDVIRRILAKTDLPTAIAYEDEANTFTLANTFQNTVTLTGTTTTLDFTETGATTDQQRFRVFLDSGQLSLRSLTDAGTLVSTPFTAQHSGSLILSPFSKQVLPSAAYEGTIGSPIQKWQAGYFAEFQADMLTSSETLATSGGRWLVAPSTTLIEDIGTGTTTIKVKHNNLANNDVIYLENQGRVEFMTVTSSATRINKAGIGNLSAESGTTNWATGGTATLTSDATEHWHGGKSLKWAYTSGTADIRFAPASMLANSTAYTVSVYVKRADAAAVVPVAGGAYRLYVDQVNNVTCNANVQDVGDGWFRLYCNGTTGGSGASGVGVLGLPTTTNHFFDAVQVETGSTLTPWSRDSSSYTVTRNADSSGADSWEAGSFMQRTSSTYNAMAVRTAVGNLNGLFGYATDIFGFAAGDAAAANVTIDATNGVRMRNSTTNKLTISTGGVLTIAEGAVTLDNTGIVVAMNTSSSYADANAYRFSDSINSGEVIGLGAYYDSGFASGALRWLELRNNSGSALQAIRLRAVAIGAGSLGSDSPNTYLDLQGGSSLYDDLKMGSITGDVLVQSGSYVKFNNGTTTTVGIGVQNSGTSPGHPWIYGDGSNLSINVPVGSGLYLNLATAATTVSRGAFVPYVTDTYVLGASTSRWEEIWFDDNTQVTGSALFPLVSNGGKLMAKNDGLNGTTTCTAGQKVSAIVVEFGIVISITCS